MSESCGNALLFLLHLFLLIPTLIDLTLAHDWQLRTRFFYYATLLAAAGSLTGTGLEMALMTAPAALVFTMTSSASILAGALVYTLAFREKRTPRWYGTLALTLAAILLSNGESLWRASGA